MATAPILAVAANQVPNTVAQGTNIAMKNNTNSGAVKQTYHGVTLFLQIALNVTGKQAEQDNHQAN